MGYYDAPTAPPAGSYTVTVTRAEGFNSNDGREFIGMGYRIEGGPEHGREWEEVRGMAPKQRTPLRIHLERLGVDVDAIGTAIDAGENPIDAHTRALEPVLGQTFDVDVVQNGQYRNTNVRGSASGPPPRTDVPEDTSQFATAGAPQKGDPGDDGKPIPFRAPDTPAWAVLKAHENRLL